MILIKVRDLVSSENCNSTDDANKVLDAISNALDQIETGRKINYADYVDKKVVLSFEGIDKISLSFACIAIGQLYGKFHSFDIDQHLRISEVKIHQLRTLNKAIKRAIEFYHDD